MPPPLSLQWAEAAFPGTQLGRTVPISRAGHCAAVLGDRLYVFGGANPCGLHFNDVWYLRPTDRSWHRVQCTGTSPKPRNGHSGDAVSDTELLVFGGIMQLPAKVLYDDMWILRVAVEGAAWHSVQQHGEGPSARSGHATAVHDGRLYLFGGSDDDRPLADLYSFHIDSRVWTPLATTPGPGPPPREMHVCCVVAGRLVVHGGRGADGPLHDVHCLLLADGAAGRWQPLAVTGPAVGLMAHAAVPLGPSDVLLVGGVAENEAGDDLLLSLDFDASTATQRSVDGDAVILCGRRRFAHTLSRHG
eukprot:EG_transcript_21074